MVGRLLCAGLVVLVTAAAASAQQTGGIRGVVYDKDFDAPLAKADVSIAETGQKTASGDDGGYRFADVKPGTYTLVFSKDGYMRQVVKVTVAAGQVAEQNGSLATDVNSITEMEPVVAQELKLPAGSEAKLLDVRAKSSAMVDSVSSEQLKLAAIGDAAKAMALVTGASVQDGKFAVIRGLPDRYVNSQINGVRLPTADVDKKAVELDQFPSAVIESIQVSKTFTPDQQGDASGGAVNVITKGIPDKNTLEFKIGSAYNSQIPQNGDFLTYHGTRLNTWGIEKIDPTPANYRNWPGGVDRGDSPYIYDWALAAGARHEFDTGLKVGGFGDFFYKHDASYWDDGRDDSWILVRNEPKMTPKLKGSPDDEFTTMLYDMTVGKESVQWGGLATLGAEMNGQSVTATYMYTRIAEDTAYLAEDTRGKQYYFPGYNVNNPLDPGNQYNFDNGWDNRWQAHYVRLETMKYQERTTQTFQLHGEHTFPIDPLGGERFKLLSPKLDWTLSRSFAGLYEPDKHLFGSTWVPGWYFADTWLEGPQWYAYKPRQNFTIGNLQRIWKEINEDSDQYSFNLKFPFKQWTDDEGYLKVGIFKDKVRRSFNQDSFSNLADNRVGPAGDWSLFWSNDWIPAGGGISGDALNDVDYIGKQNITAWYYMLDVPVTSWLSFMGGVRTEKTELEITNTWEQNAIWINQNGYEAAMKAEDVNVKYNQTDHLPALAFTLKPIKNVTLRGSYTETVARQTFKELTPIAQSEYLGGDVFAGNPDLKMSALKNYDLRLDWTPHKGALYSVSWFYKDIKLPIEYVQRFSYGGYSFIRPFNYPEGWLEGMEVEARENLGHYREELKGLTVGANATFIKSEVTLAQDDVQQLANNGFPMTKRDMTNTPNYLYNLYTTYDIERYGTTLGLFYSVRGDALVAGAGIGSGAFQPSIYARHYGTLNFTLTQKLNKPTRKTDPLVKLTFQAKNLLNPKIDTYYKSETTHEEVTRTSYTKGMEFYLGISAEW